MKKLIVYGVRNIDLRRKIEYFLDGQYEIIGYTDSHYKYDIMDGKPFFHPEDLCRQDFDFVLISTGSAATQTQIRRILLALGVPSEKIIKPTMFTGKGGEKGQADLIENIDCHYAGEKGLIFGLSYSAWGIREKNLRGPFYNCSWSGLDLYYNFSMYQYIEKQTSFAGVKSALFVFPYYYFDYDMSKSFNQYESGQIFSVRKLDDWHHFEQVPGAYDYVINYRMFGEKITRFYHMPKWKGESPYILKEPDESIFLDPIWFSDYENTVEENKKLFCRFYQQVKSQGSAPVVVIPPFYLNGLDRVSRTAFQAKKEKFHGILMELKARLGEIVVYDFADRFEAQRELFREVTHLNSKGAEAFTKLIDQEVLGQEKFAGEA